MVLRGRWGAGAAQNREAHGCADRAPMDGFTACFAPPPLPNASDISSAFLLPRGSRRKKNQIQIQIQIQRQKPKSQFLALLLLLLLPLLPPWGSMRPRPQETVEGRPGGLRRTVRRMDAPIELTWTYLQRVLRSPPGLPHTHQSRRVKPQPRALLGFTRFPKKIALINSRSVPCQYLRCAGSSANNTTLPCPCADTSSHALPATRARLRSDR